LNLTRRTCFKKEIKKLKQGPPGARPKECIKMFSGSAMAVRKEKNCFSSCYAKTQLSDYIIHILDVSQAIQESEKHISNCPHNLSSIPSLS